MGLIEPPPAPAAARGPEGEGLQAVFTLLRAGHWEAAHQQVQQHEGLLAAWLHGLLHLQEGDLEDAENWYERAGRRFRQRGDWHEELARFEAALNAAHTR